MSSQLYAGVTPTTDQGVSTQSGVTAQLATGTGRTFATNRVTALAAGSATKAYVDAADSTFAEAAYYQTRDALNIPASSLGQPNGVAQLVSGKIPDAQTPILGSGVLRGPWGITNTYSGTTGTTPLKVADWVIGATAWSFRPLVYLIAQVAVTFDARPVVEVRIGAAADTTYASQTLVAQGVGRAYFNDTQAVAVLPGAGIGAMSDGTQTYYGPNYDTRLTVWVYNRESNDGQVSVSTTSLWAASAYITRVAS